MVTRKVKAFDKVDEVFFRDNIYPQREPVVLNDLDIGPCTSKWTMEYLAKIGGDDEVKIHVSDVPQMDFISKNFVYKTLPFRLFVQRVSQEKQQEYFLSENEKYYLCSLGANPRKDVADICKQYPTLADDIHFPPFFNPTQFFSSVFRIVSRGVQLWTHYDIMDNMLIVVSGKKRVILFPPTDALYLYLNGDKSEVLDIDNPDLEKYPEFVRTTKYECILEPGDVLFIPAMWFHNVINLEFGVAVNIFWRHLDESYYDSHDIYGNKDLLPGTRALQVIDRAIKILNELPDDYRDFYARRIISKIRRQ
ncbi:hypothetical protein LSH36_950g00055 [Paralvinella palmiformis]|uniref:tRNA wybutosine-synthesizing protein 5 n=1 Tax=Paralvinella palmiformis TaxID=53620 RepID=A0AAD9MSR8_9ANNE|nr:hypothetical protein LSH36_950g00055 [Paralvinella palmiformis]